MKRKQCKFAPTGGANFHCVQKHDSDYRNLMYCNVIWYKRQIP